MDSGAAPLPDKCKILEFVLLRWLLFKRNGFSLSKKQGAAFFIGDYHGVVT